MCKYVVAYMSYFDNVLHQQIVLASSPVKAVVKCIELYAKYPSEAAEHLLAVSQDSLETLKNTLFDQEILVSVKELP